MRTAAPEADTGSEGWTAGAGTNPAPAEEKSVAPANGGPGPEGAAAGIAAGGRRRDRSVALGVVAFAVLGRGGDPVADWESGEAALVTWCGGPDSGSAGVAGTWGTIPGRGTGWWGRGHVGRCGSGRRHETWMPTGYLTVATAEVLRSGGRAGGGGLGGGGGAASFAAVSDSIARAEADAQRGRLRLAERRRPGREFRDCGTCPEMVVVPSGSYMMGSPASEAGRADDEGATAPSDDRVYACGGSVRGDVCGVGRVRGGWGLCGGYRPGDGGWGRGSRPVIRVSWEDAQANT